MLKNDDYTTGNWLEHLCHQNYYKFIGIELSSQPHMNIPRQINFTGKFKKLLCDNVFYCLKAATKYFEL